MSFFSSIFQRRLSIFATVTLVAAAAGAAPLCPSVFSDAPSSNKPFLIELANRGWDVNLKGGKLIFKERTKSRISWSDAKAEWFSLGKQMFPNPPARAQAALLEACVNTLQSQKFNSRIEYGDQVRLIAISKSDPSERYTFEMKEVFSDKDAAVKTLARIEDLWAERDLRARAKKLRISDVDENGARIVKTLGVFRHLTETTLISNLQTQMAILSKKPYDVDAGLSAAFLTAELLVRKGFTSDVVANPRGTFLVRLQGRTDGSSSEFIKTIELAKTTSDAMFAMDPVYYSRNVTTSGVCDTLNFDFSFNIRRMWKDPAAFEDPTATLIHEIHHLENARAWLLNPHDESLQSWNGYLWAKGKELLGLKSYKTYFQFDEITAAIGDSRNDSNPFEREKFRLRALDLIRAFSVRVEMLRARVEQDEFDLSISSSGSFLNVEVDLPSPVPKSGSGLLYRFGDLDKRTPRYLIAERVLARLANLEAQLEKLRSGI